MMNAHKSPMPMSSSYPNHTFLAIPSHPYYPNHEINFPNISPLYLLALKSNSLIYHPYIYEIILRNLLENNAPQYPIKSALNARKYAPIKL